MGVSWSGSHDYIPRPRQTIKIEHCTHSIAVIFFIDKDGNVVPTKSSTYPFKDIINLNQQVIITGLYSKFIQNTFLEQKAVVTIKNLHSNLEEYDEDILKKDLKIICPANTSTTLGYSNSIVYIPVGIRIDEVKMFAGQKETFYKQDLDDDGMKLFKNDHPLVHWIKSTKTDNMFKMKKHPIEDELYHEIEESVLDKIKVYLNTTYFDKIKYTRLEDCKVECDLKNIKKRDGSTITVLLEMNYIIVNDNL